MVDLTAVATLVTIASTALVGLIAQVQKSRCKVINLCCGIVKCTREVPNVDNLEDIEKNPVESDRSPLGIVEKMKKNHLK